MAKFVTVIKRCPLGDSCVELRHRLQERRVVDLKVRGYLWWVSGSPTLGQWISAYVEMIPAWFPFRRSFLKASFLVFSIAFFSFSLSFSCSLISFFCWASCSFCSRFNFCSSVSSFLFFLPAWPELSLDFELFPLFLPLPLFVAFFFDAFFPLACHLLAVRRWKLSLL